MAVSRQKFFENSAEVDNEFFLSTDEKVGTVSAQAVFKQKNGSARRETPSGRFRQLQSLDPKVLDDYLKIGEVLQICEVSSWRVGVPWVYPTEKVQTLREKYQRPLEDFIRLQLIRVPTPTLEAYHRELSAWPAETQSGNFLNINCLSAAERYALTGIVCILSTALSLILLFGVLQTDFSTGGIILSIIVGTLGISFALLSGEGFRRATLCTLIAEEISRRRNYGDHTQIPQVTQ